MLAAGGRVVLLDFGIARIEQSPWRGEMISGSPHFMAPEAIRGTVKRGEAHLVDLYALAIVAYVLFTGCAPFEDDDPIEVLVKQLEMHPPLLAAERPDLPAPLCAIVQPMLAKKSEDRPERIEIVADTLRLIARHRDDDRPGIPARRLPHRRV